MNNIDQISQLANLIANQENGIEFSPRIPISIHNNVAKMNYRNSRNHSVNHTANTGAYINNSQQNFIAPADAW